MIKTRKWLLLTVCVLCVLVAVLGLTFTAYAADDATAQNVITKSSDGSELTSEDLALTWTYGTGEIISYTYRPKYGDTAYYTLAKDGQELDKFGVKFVDNNAMLYEVKNGEIDTATPLAITSLKAYLKTLKAGDYTLTITAPAGGTAPNAYSEVTQSVSIKVNTYAITAANWGTELKCRVINPEMAYTGAADNLPQIELKFDTADGSIILVEGEDYTLSSESVNVGYATLTIKGIGSLTGEMTVNDAYKIVAGVNSVSDVYVARWKFGEYDRKVNLFTANAKWGAENLYFAIATDNAGENYVEGLDEIRLTDGMVSTAVEERLNKLDAKKTYYLFAIVDGGANYYTAQSYSQFDVVEITNTWTTTPNVVSWEWHGFDENVNVINAVPAFGNVVKFEIYKKNGEELSPLTFGGKTSFEYNLSEDNGTKLPANVSQVLSNLAAGTYYLFASVISDSDNYSSINAEFSENALVPFRVLQATNYWTQIPNISNWTYGAYDAEVNAITATAAHGSANIKYSIYMQNGENINIIKFGDTTSFTINSEGAVPTVVSEGLKMLGVGRYYLRAVVDATNNYTGLQEVVADFSKLSSFDVIKAENYWTTAPAINAWAEGSYSNEDNLPVAVAHYGVAHIVITDVNDEENVVYDSEKSINKLAEVGVGAYLLTVTVAGTDSYGELTFDRIFHVFVPETAQVGIPWWLVAIIVVCSLGVLVFIFWLLHEKGVLQMLTGKMVVNMRTKATMVATIAAVKANKVAEEAKESVKLAEELDRLEAEQVETEEDDSVEEVESILIDRDEETGLATFVRYQKHFSVKLIQATDEAKEYYSYLKNVLLSYKKVKSKVSKGYDAFNKGRNQLAKLVIRGKTLCLYLALNPDDYADSKYKVERSESKKFAQVPCLYRIKSDRRLKYAEELIDQLCEKLAIARGTNHNIDYRPPYESTEALLEKGLIKKIVYTRKYDSFIKDNLGTSIAVKTDDQSELKLQEVAAADTEAATVSDAAAASENPSDDNKKDQGEE